MRQGKPCVDHLGNTYPTISAMCKKWGLTDSQFWKRRKSGLSIEAALTIPHKCRLGNQTTDHLGNVFSSEQAMFRHYNTDYTRVHYRMEHLGMSLKDALTLPINVNTGGDHETTDHLGNKFPTKEAMCTYYGIPRATFFRRLRIGWTLEETLTKPLKHTYKPKKKLIDPNGDQFASIEEMCAKWNIPKKDYITNIKHGLSVKEALTHKPDVNWSIGSTECHDHLGNAFPSFNAMCKHYGIDKGILRGRLDLGWTLKEILTNPTKKTPSKQCHDHLGNKYTSQKEMLEKYGLHPTMFNWRKRRGWTLKECLLGKEEPHNNPCVDATNTSYFCELHMCIYNNIQTSTYYSRIKRMSQKDTVLKFSPRTWDRIHGITIKKELSNNYYEVDINNESLIMSAVQVIEWYRNNIINPKLGYKILGYSDDYYTVELLDSKEIIKKDIESISKDLTNCSPFSVGRSRKPKNEL